MLAEKAPFISDNLIFTGSKSSRILGVDMKSGRLLHDSGSGLGGGSLAGSFSREKKIPMMPAIDKHKANDRSKDILDFAEEYETDIAEAAENSSFGPSTTSLWFGRVDYTLRCYSPPLRFLLFFHSSHFSICNDIVAFLFSLGPSIQTRAPNPSI